MQGSLTPRPDQRLRECADSRALEDHRARLESSRARIVRAIGTPPDLTLVRPHGNIGDRLIQAGTRRLLSGIPGLAYQETGLEGIRRCTGHTALLGGSGGWCGPYHGLAGSLATLESRFKRVIVLPSSFDVAVDDVARALSGSKALFFAREEVSFRQIRPLCRAEIAHDMAFFFDYRPYRHDGAGTLTAFRTDQESAFRSVPRGNCDISVACGSLDEWLWTIARHDLVRTDRAHVMIAAALLGKRVEYLASSYHKLPAIADFGLRGFPVASVRASVPDEDGTAGERLTEAWRLRMLQGHAVAHVPVGDAFILIDDGELGPLDVGQRTRLPFLERDGVYWGRPRDDSEAVSCLERMRSRGIRYLIVAWPAFWWLSHYRGFARHLSATAACRGKDDSAILYELDRARGAG